MKNKVTQGVIGFTLSLLGVLFAFQQGTENYYLYILFLAMVIAGVIIVADSLKD
jgi:fumarate reductase subunit C|tara:strand:- start:261 stop:422 length:162 start_codon:yes stop_codon:yes gene_type:complete